MNGETKKHILVGAALAGLFVAVYFAGYGVGGHRERARLTGEYTQQLADLQRVSDAEYNSLREQFAATSANLERAEADNNRLNALHSEATAIIGESAKLVSTNAGTIKEALAIIKRIREQIALLADIYIRGDSNLASSGVNDRDTDQYRQIANSTKEDTQ